MLGPQILRCPRELARGRSGKGEREGRARPAEREREGRARLAEATTMTLQKILLSSNERAADGDVFVRSTPGEMMSRGGAAVGIFAIGATYWLGLLFVNLLLFTAIAFLAALAITIGIVVVAAVSWWGCLRQAVRERDFGWLRDLIVAPVMAVFIALYFGMTAALLMRDAQASEAIESANENLADGGLPLLIAVVLGPAAFFVFLALLIATPTLLKRRSALRLLAYPAFAAYSFYLSGLAIVMTNDWDSTDGARLGIAQDAAIAEYEAAGAPGATDFPSGLIGSWTATQAVSGIPTTIMIEIPELQIGESLGNYWLGETCRYEATLLTYDADSALFRRSVAEGTWCTGGLIEFRILGSEMAYDLQDLKGRTAEGSFVRTSGP